jgi:bifunctional non-homologous end joining protein LigD
MSRHHRKPGKRKDQELSSRLYRVPSDDDSIRGKILIDIRPERKDLASLIEMALRKLTVATKTKMPNQVVPMQPSIVTEPFDDPDWQFELERNGYRTLAYLKSGHVKLHSTAISSYHQKFFTIRDALSEWNINAVVDGVVVMVSSETLPSSESFQQWEKNEQDQLFYHAFDLLWLEGWNLMNEPLYIRREILKQLIPESGVIRFSDHIDGVGKEFFQMVREHQLGGVIAKNKHSVYTPGVRSEAWRVVRANDR